MGLPTFKELHNSFQRLFHDVVELRKRANDHDDWIVQCFESCSFFETTFRDPAYCEQWLKEREANHRATRQVLSDELATLMTNGLGYSKIEEMNRRIPKVYE